MTASKHWKWQRPPVPPPPEIIDVVGDDDGDDGPAPAGSSGKRWSNDVDYNAKTPDGPKRVRVRLGTQEDVARQMRQTYGLVLSGEISAIEAARRGRLLKSMGEVLALSTIERRLSVIERNIQKRGQK